MNIPGSGSSPPAETGTLAIVHRFCRVACIADPAQYHAAHGGMVSGLTLRLAAGHVAESFSRPACKRFAKFNACPSIVIILCETRTFRPIVLHRLIAILKLTPETVVILRT